jgi:FkbM family methyltransferase
MFSVKNLLVDMQNYFVIRLVTLGIMSVRQSNTFVRLGSDYGGWWIPKDVLDDKSKNRLMISVGLGFDVTFDQALLDSGFEVIGLDPLKDSINYANHELRIYPKFTSINMGLWTKTGIEKFFPPKNRTHDSWSATNIQNVATTDFEEFNVISLHDLFSRFPQIEQADFCAIKMDIEGSEIQLIPALVNFRTRFDLLAIEMDFLSLIPFLSLWTRICMICHARKMLKSLKQKNYELVMNENFNFIWI